jgi:hypothetical protein
MTRPGLRSVSASVASFRKWFRKLHRLTANIEVVDGNPIRGHIHILRSFSPAFVLDLPGGGKRPDSRAFNEIRDKESDVKAMSVYRTDLLDEDGIPYEEIIAKHPSHLIVSHPAQTYADLSLSLRAAPEEGRVGRAHMHVAGLTGGRKNRLVEAVLGGPGRWVKGPA